MPYDPTLMGVFENLRVAASFFEHGAWRRIHGEPDLVAFEQQHGLEHARHVYNRRCIVQARQKRRPVLGTHAGFHDWFVPVLDRGQARAMLVTGPFASAPPESSGILERWHALTGRQGHPADPEFSHYLSINLSTLVLDAGQTADFGRLLAGMAGVMGGDETPELGARVAALREKLDQVRFAERTWDAARSMVDQRTTRVWSSRHRAEDAGLLGLSRPADRVLVGLTVPRRADTDPIEDLLNRHRFQRACVELARRAGDVICGQVGDHGVVFLSAKQGSAARKRQFLDDLGTRGAAIGRRFGLLLHQGSSDLPASASISDHYRAALQAAEMALSQGVRVVTGAPRAEHAPSALGELRRELAMLAEQNPKALAACFERYVETVATHCAYRRDPIHVHLEVGIERIVDGLLRTGVIARKNLTELEKSLERSATEARTLSELFAVYRAAVSDMRAAALHPVSAGRDRNLRRAVQYIHEHYAEPLTQKSAARVAGFAPNYFSALFKQREQMTFARYVQRLRLERAHQLLATTDLGLEQIAQLSGFGVANYMARIFRKAYGASPRAVRKKLR